MITEDYVSFETAKLLKQKGFDEACTLSHFDLDAYKKWFETAPRPITIDADSEKPFRYPVPTLQMAMKWLRKVHHYYIRPMLDSSDYNGHLGYYALVQKIDSEFESILVDKMDKVFYDNPEEACEVAINYCLELI